MFVVLDHRALEASLPDVAAALVEAVVAVRVRDQQALHDAADRRGGRAQEQMDVIAHQAVAVQVERLPRLEVGEGLEERDIVAVGENTGWRLLPRLMTWYTNPSAIGRKGRGMGASLSPPGRVRKRKWV